MTLNIDDRETISKVQKISEFPGLSLDQVVVDAVRELWAKEAEREALVAAAMEIVRRTSSLPNLDDRSADEIIGYNEIGVPE